MAYVTVAEAVAASREVWPRRDVVESELRKSAPASIESNFDILMSHSFEDAEVILGVKILIEGARLRVYVDWIEDGQLNRGKVTKRTAKILRQRMAHCNILLYASSNQSPRSRWMPWELGYFDGLKGRNNVGIIQYS